MAGNRTYFNYTAAVFWFLLVTFLLCLPGTEFPKATWLTRIWIDKWVHIFLFMTLTFLWCRAFKENSNSSASKIKFLKIAITGVVYGITMELIQAGFIPFRGFEIGDIVADMIGAFIGYYFATRRYIKK